MPEAKSNRAVLAAIAVALPGVTESTTHRGWSFKVRGKLLACEAIHQSAEPGSAVIKIGLGDRDRLLEDQPDAFYVTDHYRPYSSILVRLEKVDRKSLRTVLELAHRFVTGKQG